MELITKEIERRLLENGRRPDEDHRPVVKFFDPCGAATWLITQMDPDEPDILFGLCDLGLGFPELGSVRLSELESVEGPLGLGIERDLYFEARYPLSRSEEHTSELQSLMRISYAVFCLQKKKKQTRQHTPNTLPKPQIIKQL